MSCASDQVRSSRTTSAIPIRTREAIEEEVRRRVEAERANLRARLATPPPRQHFQRPVERPFTAAERDRVTILFGGLTSKHEWLIKSVFQSAGYKVETRSAAFQRDDSCGVQDLNGGSPHCRSVDD
jgi:hypothetical protein